MVYVEGREVGLVGRRQNRGDKWLRVVGRIGDDKVLGRRGDKQTIGAEQMIMG